MTCSAQCRDEWAARRTCKRYELDPAERAAGVPTPEFGPQPENAQPPPLQLDGDPPEPEPNSEGQAANKWADTLRSITAEPATRTVRWIPRGIQARVADVILTVLVEHTRAETRAAASAAADVAEAAATQSRWLWAIPTLLLRDARAHAGPLDDDADADDNEDPDKRPRKGAETRSKAMRRRLAQAEAGRWQELGDEYLRERAETPPHPAQHDPQDDEHARHRRTAKQMREARGIGHAKQMLCGKGVAPPTGDTRSALAELLQADEPEGEQAAIADEAAECLRGAGAAEMPKAASLHKHIRSLNLAAQPGPSGWRPGLLQAVHRRPGAPRALRAWAALWRTGRLTEASTRLWTAGLVALLVKGADRTKPGGMALRPIALCEVLVKMTEGAYAAEESDRIIDASRYRQLGTGQADGAVIITRALQSWAHEAATREQSERQAS